MNGLLTAQDLDRVVANIEESQPAGIPNCNYSFYEINILPSDEERLGEFIVDGCWRGNKRFPVRTHLLQ